MRILNAMNIQFGLCALLLLGGCVTKRNVPVSDIPKLGKLEEVMDVQATIMDPLFKKAGEPAFSDADWAAFTDASARIQASSLHVKDFTKGPEFDALAVRLHDLAASLGTAASGKDVAGAQTALRDMKSTCKECHKRFR